jgi:glycerol kinase
MSDGARIRPATLKVDGGMAQNGLFLQRLADIVDMSILRPKMAESTAFGAACLAGLGSGTYSSLEELTRLWQADARCEPRMDAATPDRELSGWREALKRVRTAG